MNLVNFPLQFGKKKKKKIQLIAVGLKTNKQTKECFGKKTSNMGRSLFRVDMN